ncbi:MULTISPECIES: Uma2 family endonuclease [Kitasatospora]|uniref:Uma2 family endonuclease n=1 Tax=Kitasatospora cathayae TaxID=3004092 RepID=A0ABY7QA97_9ACTN|nr:Uma2 family endonuclease [Kitasatospora sp. HUAS 3-15]WBP89687.1 Uma2 family endonuclease [Kitasatospora sp. HUAS 3-15]
MSFYERHREYVEEVLRTAPEGVRVEWSGDTLIMQAAPSSIHQLNIGLVQRQFERHVPDGYMFSGYSALTTPDVTKERNPDLTYLPIASLARPGDTTPAEEALIAVEVVSPSNPGNDWVDKLRDYAVMGIPLYLIVDPREGVVTLFSEPNRDRYHVRHDRKFGDGMRIPDPFDFDLDLSGLVRYPD